ncbi:hypothetical protein [Pseudolactococcus reticulitermitis]|uniref:30S ribosomal protein S9 n=1 Tax=Pseudolactococcus reticulitermitis TaxID=2025039 RepID=A0A224XD89_9LACT|nr:hypothetical protein [Lactococcus reticulitermitis]GAX47571.1 hypothetical protein RsY01_1171 [Lactococcus reticulitermitis]
MTAYIRQVKYPVEVTVNKYNAIEWIVVLPTFNGREKLNQTTKEKMLEIIKKKQAGGGRSSQETPTKNDRKHMRKGPKIFNK